MGTWNVPNPEKYDRRLQHPPCYPRTALSASPLSVGELGEFLKVKTFSSCSPSVVPRWNIVFDEKCGCTFF